MLNLFIDRSTNSYAPGTIPTLAGNFNGPVASIVLTKWGFPVCFSLVEVVSVVLYDMVINSQDWEFR